MSPDRNSQNYLEKVVGNLQNVPHEIIQDLGKGAKDVGAYIQRILPRDENGNVRKMTIAEGLAALASLGFIGTSAVNEYKRQHNMPNASIGQVLEDMTQHPGDAFKAVEIGVPQELRRGVQALGNLVQHVREGGQSSMQQIEPPKNQLDAPTNLLAEEALKMPPPTGPIRPTPTNLLDEMPNYGMVDPNATWPNDKITSSMPEDTNNTTQPSEEPPALKMPEPTSPLYHPDRNPFRAFVVAPTEEKPNIPAVTTTKTRLVFTRPGFEGYSIHPNVKKAIKWVFSPYRRQPEDGWVWQKSANNS